MIILGNKFDGTNYEVEHIKTNKKEVEEACYRILAVGETIDI